MRAAIAFDVHAEPAPKGSKRPFRNKATGRIMLVESSKKAKPFGQAVISAACDAANSAGACCAIQGPVGVELVFRLRRPASQTKAQRVLLFQSKKPDVDKLARCVLDALTVARVWEDDAQVAKLVCWKRYARDGETLGCSVMIETLD